MTRHQIWATMVALTVILATSQAWAQTELRRVSTQPPGKAQTGGTFPPAMQPSGAPTVTAGGQSVKPAQGAAQSPVGQPAQATGAVPMSEGVYKQAVQQAEGVYPIMDRAGAGGQIQESWNISDKREGVYVTRACEECVYKVRTREMMTTTIVLPVDAVIVGRQDLGDPVGFKVEVRGNNMIAVRPESYGMDTNLNVYTKSGRVYPFYIRSESFNSMFVPDLMVKIVGREKPAVVEGLPDAAEPSVKGTGKPRAGARVATPPKPSGDFVRNVPLDISKFHGWRDYDLSGDSDLKPEAIWRDDFFTYIQYGKKWDGMELSTAYATIDEIDELVNSHVEGSVFVVESVTARITLKNGKKFLCIQYTGEQP